MQRPKDININAEPMIMLRHMGDLNDYIDHLEARLKITVEFISKTLSTIEKYEAICDDLLNDI